MPLLRGIEGKLFYSPLIPRINIMRIAFNVQLRHYSMKSQMIDLHGKPYLVGDYGIEYIPMVLFTTPDGTEIVRNYGLIDEEEIQEILEEITHEYSPVAKSLQAI